MSTAILPTPTDLPASPRMTAEEFVARYDGKPFELVNGIPLELPMGGGLRHGLICANIGAMLLIHVDAHQLGQVMSNDPFVKTGPDSVRGPDVLFYSYERLPKDQPVPTGFHTQPPDLVVEVKSPSNSLAEMLAKVVEYLRIGVRAVVLIDPEKPLVTLYQGDDQCSLGLDDTLTLPAVLPGFAMPIRRLFE